jgi:hypothetical protein
MIRTAQKPSITSSPIAEQRTEETVESYCARNGVIDEYRKGLGLIPQVVQLTAPVRAELSEDGDTGEQWVTLLAPIGGSQQEMCDAFDRLTAAWIKAFPPAVREHLKADVTVTEI